MKTTSTQVVMDWLETVKDPEIPVLSITDMGIVRNVSVEHNEVVITITPTFVGCPAIDMIRDDIITTLRAKGIPRVRVDVSFRQPWSSEDITEKGRSALKSFGLAPPPKGMIEDLDILEYATCPRCDGSNTELKTPFGPTLCRSMHYCHDCKEAFEQFKPV
jgi:ring-1,2-phenylacetyl-CoA epoxidase subunit PaaD